ncbi:MAG: DUF262 domain-containing protein [Bacteroidales bacterium]
MEENKIELKSISKLLGMNFFIPSYQRGYRWTEQQVKDLLNDICNFKPEKDEWYCLQPLVVKEITEDMKQNFNLKSEKDDNKWYEVIDGQQRLTTISLIIHYFNEMWVGKQKISEPIINYKTRDKSYEFLKKMAIGENDIVTIDDSNIDYWHISKAYETIHKWVIGKGSFNYNDFQSNFKEKTKVIWYEVAASQDGRDIFTRINMGKIRLTNAELIKALFLNSSNFKTNEGKNDDEKKIMADKIRLKQLEIAGEWDFIEYSLHNDEFWWFINKEANEKDTRIEFLFELLVGKSGNKEDDTYTFRKYSEKFKDKSEKEIEDNWKQIKRYFQTLQDWFDNRELYHKIGFLVTIGEGIKNLIDEAKMKDKAEFIGFIDEKIRDKFKNIQLADLEKKNDASVRMVLLLHNIQTMLNNKEENTKFPFNRYKKKTKGNKGWDVEHIHAVATEIPQKQEQCEDWQQYAKELLKAIVETNENKTKGKELLSRCEKYDENAFKSLFEEVTEFVGDEDVNDLSNLALLDLGTNREYKNEFFSYKRDKIIEKDKTNTFIPICTKNAFMKYYTQTDKIKQMTFWGESDRKAYFENIKEVLKQYLLTQTEEE